MKTITINVTKRDIRDGKCSEPNDCPVSLAATRRFGMEISVGSSFMEAEGLSGSVKHSDRVQEFISKFDNRFKVKPIRFPVTVPNSWI